MTGYLVDPSWFHPDDEREETPTSAQPGAWSSPAVDDAMGAAFAALRATAPALHPLSRTLNPGRVIPPGAAGDL